MKCRFCKTEIDTSKSEVVDGICSTWYGWYHCNELVEVTCLECLRKNREAWKTMSKETKERLKGKK